MTEFEEETLGLTSFNNEIEDEMHYVDTDSRAGNGAALKGASEDLDSDLEAMDYDNRDRLIQPKRMSLKRGV